MATSCPFEYSEQSIFTKLPSPPFPNTAASAFAVSLLPTPVGPRKASVVIGLLSLANRAVRASSASIIASSAPS